MPRVTAGGYTLDYLVVQHEGASREPIVFLHHGFGSVSTWKDFPERVALQMGREGLVYSRPGCGQSEPLPAPRNGDYLFYEAETILPQLLDRLSLDRVALFGHSDGASTSLLSAAAFPNRIIAAVIEAPHVVIEDITVEGVTEVARRYEQDPEFRRRVAQHHTDPDGAFWSWARVWLNPTSRSWSMVNSLERVRCPLLLIQGDADQYGTLKQLNLIQRHVSGPTQRLGLAGCGHDPHLERPDEVIEAACRFLNQAN